MRLPSYTVLARLSFVIAAGLLVFIFTYKRPAPVQAAPVAKNEHVVENYIKEVELKNEQERDAIEKTQRHEKLVKAKKESVECKFWTQQKASSSQPNPKTDEKIAKFCELEETIEPI
jgi:hypothetical protein